MCSSGLVCVVCSGMSGRAFDGVRLLGSRMILKISPLGQVVHSRGSGWVMCLGGSGRAFMGVGTRVALQVSIMIIDPLLGRGANTQNRTPSLAGG